MSNRHETNLPTGSEYCRGKKSYDSHTHAHRAARNIRRYENERVREFWCAHCHTWHVGHAPITTKLKRTDDDWKRDLDTFWETWYV